ncbi:hypothetical protein [Breoghania sp.]|uniref:hypothetical protein n=1 Tax=Breoghania sp. TaxID=2065378 RepID=UPI00261AC409|nr:hypothetical protein [Breoghania sp.]MDJ0930027.1 hypothetical protein [Breoghania sp.]
MRQRVAHACAEIEHAARRRRAAFERTNNVIDLVTGKVIQILAAQPDAAGVLVVIFGGKPVEFSLKH